MKSIGKKAKLTSYCSDCERDTNQVIVCGISNEETYPEYLEKNEFIDVTAKNSFNVICCLGCDTYSFLRTTSYSNMLDDNNKPLVLAFPYPDEEFESNEYAELFLQKKEVNTLPPIVKALYNEVAVAFEHRTSILAGMGLRSLIEALCLQRNITGNNLKVKIENLYKEGYISKNEMPILQRLREMGNTTVHQIKKPSFIVLSNALSIINHTLKTIYIIPKMDKKISK